MNSHLWRLLFAMGPSSGQNGQSTAPFWVQMFPLVLMIVVFYFIFIVPQQKKAKQHDQLVKTLKAGDKVVTSSGILGVVIAVKDRTVSIRSADTKLEILKSAVSEVTERSSASSGG